MADAIKLKFKIGVNEFEMEGPAEAVLEQAKAFREMMESAPKAAQALPRTTGAMLPAFTLDPPADDIETTNFEGLQVDRALPKIMMVDHRTISLTVRAASIDDAVLLIVYGQKAMRDNDSVTGGDVMEGLTVSGLRVLRVDRLLEKLGDAGDIIVLGVGRAKRYRLTNAGLTKARTLAARLLATVA